MNTVLWCAHIWKTLHSVLLCGQILYSPTSNMLLLTEEKASCSLFYQVDKKFLFFSISLICQLVTRVHFRAMSFLSDS